MSFVKMVLAYLTGWVIAQTFYNRVIRRWRDSDWDHEKRDIAVKVAAELESRGASPVDPKVWTYRDVDGVNPVADRIYAELLRGPGVARVTHQDMRAACHRAFRAVIEDG